MSLVEEYQLLVNLSWFPKEEYDDSMDGFLEIFSLFVSDDLHIDEMLLICITCKAWLIMALDNEEVSSSSMFCMDRWERHMYRQQSIT